MNTEIPEMTFAPIETPLEKPLEYLPDNTDTLLPPLNRFEVYAKMAGLPENTTPDSLIPDPDNPGDTITAGDFIARELKEKPGRYFQERNQQDDPGYGEPLHNQHDCPGEDSPKGVHGHDWPN